MEAIKGIYHDGLVELIDKPEDKEVSEVLVIFPEKQKKITKIGGMFKNHNINYDEIKDDLKKLSTNSETHLIKDQDNNG